VSRATRTLAIRDANHPAQARSADCVSCHVEHRSQTALAATSDAHCLICHENLAGATDRTTVANRVVAFDAVDHPAFGRHLNKRDGKAIDPTVVKFNHRYHMEKVSELRDAANECVRCHMTSNDDRRYMQPVSYARDCIGCHALSLPSGPTLAHQ